MREFLRELALILLVVVAGTAALLLINSAAYATPPPDEQAAYLEHADNMNIEYDLPPGLVRAICSWENRSDKNWRNVAGGHGEIGVCQIKPSTAAAVCPECIQNAKRRLFLKGSRGFEVARIQAVLAREKLYDSAIDGVYGVLTDRAVRLYQHDENIAVDGLVGPQTWRKLFGSHDPFPGASLAESLWDPFQNIEWAARVMAYLRDNVSPDPMVIAAAYNSGPGGQVVRYMVGVQRFATSVRPVKPKSGAGEGI